MCEGWHSKINKRTRTHPRLFSLIILLKQLQGESENDLRMLNIGKQIKEPRRKKYRKIDKGIKEMRVQMTNREINEYQFLDRVTVVGFGGWLSLREAGSFFNLYFSGHWLL